MRDASGIYFVGLRFDIAVSSDENKADEIASKYAEFCKAGHCPMGELPCPFLLEISNITCKEVTPEAWRKIMEVF